MRGRAAISLLALPVAIRAKAGIRGKIQGKFSRLPTYRCHAFRHAACGQTATLCGRAVWKNRNIFFPRVARKENYNDCQHASGGDLPEAAKGLASREKRHVSSLIICPVTRFGFADECRRLDYRPLVLHARSSNGGACEPVFSHWSVLCLLAPQLCEEWLSELPQFHSGGGKCRQPARCGRVGPARYAL